MKKNISRSSTAIACLLFAGTFAGSAQAVDVNLNFTGRVVGGACTVSTGSRNQSIPMGNFKVSDFPNIGSISNWIEANISLENCDAGIANVDFAFTGTPHPNKASGYQLTQSAGVAGGLAVIFRRWGIGGDIPPNTTYTWNGRTSYNGIYNFSVAYERVGTVTPGSANTTVTAVLSYR